MEYGPKHSAPAADASQTVEGGEEIDPNLLRESDPPGSSDVDAVSDRYPASKLGKEWPIADATKTHPERPGKGTQESMDESPQLLTAS